MSRWLEALLPLFEETTRVAGVRDKLEGMRRGNGAQTFGPKTWPDHVNGHSGLRAYVKATSGLWHETGKNFELMTLADVLWPSLLYLPLHPDTSYQRVVDGLLESLPLFYHADTRSISNDLMRGQNETLDSWYPFENSLIKYPVIGALAGLRAVTEKFLDCIRNGHAHGASL